MEKYKWLFDDSGVLTECDPKIDGDTKLEYAPESGEIFYRAKLNGTLAFRFEFDDILAKGFGYEHIIVLQRYDGTDFVEVWRGKFALTDCTIDYETHTITVSPQTLDRYTKVLEALDTEYNIVKLAPGMQPVDILIRPLLQIYAIKDTKISNYIGNNYWEKDCNSVERNDIDQYKFGYQKQYISAIISFGDWSASPEYSYRTGQTITYTGEVIYGGLPQESTRVYGQYWDGSEWQTDTLMVRVAQMTTTTEFQFYGNPDLPGAQQSPIVTATYEAYGMGTVPEITHVANVTDAKSQWDMLCARILVQTDKTSVEIHGHTYTIDDIPANDMAGSNLNYNKTLYVDCAEIIFSSEIQDEPTQWGRSYADKYFVKPADSGFTRWIPVGQSTWKYLSIWWRVDAPSVLANVNDELTATQRIKDCYELRQTILKLFEKAGSTATTLLSGVMGGSNPYVGANFLPVISPRSNVISSYYNTPAQNAPISLAKIFRMLKQAYKLYWYIDSNNDIRIEHISYFQNGYSYTENPQQLVDLDSTLHTRTRHSKAFGQNVVKFIKADMPGAYTFGWADQQTIPFDGYDIKCLDSYVDKAAKSENIVGDFDTDVDFVLSSPNDVSKDGFFLFALPKVPGGYSTQLIIEHILLTDENGDSFYIDIQNADGAFCKIQKTFWRYDMPCEHLQINNQTDTAITTGRFKQQSVEFADLSMEDVIGDIDNCVKLIRTQQGDGGISKLSVNLNSLATSADLLFTLFGRKYYLKGTALNGTLTFILNGETITINVENNRFIYGYTEPIADLTFKNTDVVSVDFSDADALDSLTSADEMFENCVELVGVDFGNKTFGAVTSATDMFAGCVNLTTLICPATETWKADIDFTDCPALTLESFEGFIDNYLFVYDSGVHTITPNSTMWNNLAAEIQTDLMAKATAKGWQIGIPAQYSLTGTSAGSTVYVTINGTPVEIAVSGGVWQYDYNTPITTISFLNDTNVQTIDFSNSDLLAGVSSLANAFKGCSGLVAVDFTGCDLSNVSTAADCFAGCSALTTISADSGVWMPDVDLSDTAMVYADMLSTIGILYTYTTGTHTITFNSTTWDSFTQAQQQTISDAAQLKGWTTNAVMVIYHIKGTATSATVTIHIDSTDVVVNVENGAFDYQYMTPITQLAFGDITETTHDEFLTIDLSEADDFAALLNCANFLRGCRQLTRIDATQTFENVTDAARFFWICGNALEINMPNATFANASISNFIGALYPKDKIFTLPSFIGGYSGAVGTFIQNCQNMEVVNLPNATFANITSCNYFITTTPLKELLLPSATFASVTNAANMFNSQNNNLRKLEQLDLTSATFASCTDCSRMFYYVGYQSANYSQLEINMPNATFANVTNAQYMFGAFGGVKINMPLATFGTYNNFQYFANEMAHCAEINFASFTAQYATTLDRWFNMDSALQTLVLPNTALCNVAVPLPSSPLSYQSMLNVANWCKDRSGLSALSVTFKATAWNALSAAEQSTIDGILSGKNWTRAIA